MNIQIKNKLGSGVMGDVYLSKIDGVDTITKIEKYDGDMTTKSPFIRQLIFNDTVAKLYPDRFMTLVSSSIINNCNYKHKLPEEVTLNRKKELKLRDFYEKCCILSYKPILKYTLNQVRNKLSAKNKLKIFKYLLKSINILHHYGFIHGDLHGNNIMCDKTMTKWYIIDYGSIYHKSFIKNKSDKFVANTNFENIHYLIWQFIDNPVYDYIEKHHIKLPDFKLIIKYIKDDERYTLIKKHLHKKLKTINNKSILNESICEICAILYYDLYIDALGMTNTPIGKKYRNFKQPNETYLLNVVKM